MNSKRRGSWRGLFGHRTIVHVDMDAFFAQVEALDNPAYRGKPLVVGGPRDSARGVVSTCSYEARRYGIRSAMPIRQAVRLCPEAIFIPPRMQRYVEVSRDIHRVLESFTPVVEPLSIDEAFLDMTGCEHFYADPWDLGTRLKQRLRQATGLTASVGIAPNKFLAKLASDKQKPDGLVIVTQDDVDAFLSPLPVEDLWGVGPKTAVRLRQAGLETVADVRACPLAELSRIVGRSGAAHLHALAFGRDERPVEPPGDPKSIGSETTFETDVPDGPELRAHLARLVAAVGRRLRRKGMYARTVTVKIRFPDYRTYTKSHSVADPFRDDDTLFREASRLLDAFALRRPLRLLGVSVSQLQRSVQTSLFAPKEDRLTDVLDALNDRLGGRVIRRGRECWGDAGAPPARDGASKVEPTEVER